jgi:hypothetical protein
VSDERRAPQAPRRKAPPVFNGEIILDHPGDVAFGAPPPDHQARWQGKVIDQAGNDLTPPRPESQPVRKSNMQRGREMFGGIR